MYCERCGSEIGDQAMFCQICGHSVRRPEVTTTSMRVSGQASIIADKTTNLHYLLGGIVTICGLMIILSTFMSWVKVSYYDVSGIKFMTFSEMQGGIFYRWGDGLLLLTGFWSMVLGVAVILAGVLILTKKVKAGGTLTICLGAVGIVIALLNIIMTLVQVGGASESGKVGIGLWILLVFSIGTLIVGIVTRSKAASLRVSVTGT